MKILEIVKKDYFQWGAILFLFTFLYITGWHTEVLGQIQGLVIKTGLVRPSIDAQSSLKEEASYDFTLRDFKGAQIPFSSFKRKVVIINFWATWCPPCIAEMPSFQGLYEKVKKDKVQLVMISLDRSENKVRKFIDRKDYTFPVYFLEGNLPAVFRTSAIPTTFVISPRGQIVFKHEGMADYENQKFIDYINEL